MLNLSIMPLFTEHIDEITYDIVNQQKNGVSTHAMFLMTFNPEGTPPVNKAEIQCKKYDLFKEKLDKLGARHGVLVQSTLGHIYPPSEPYPFQPSVVLSDGSERTCSACPLDPDFRKYMRESFKTLAKRRPSLVMIDDDVGLLYKENRGCACKRHMAELSRRIGRDVTREELYLCTKGNSEEDKRIVDAYVELIKDSLVGCVEAMREGLDEVDPSIQGVVSGIYTSTFCEFSGDIAEAFAGKGNPKIIRLNGGPYENSALSGGARFFTSNMFRAAILRENVKDKVDLFLAETDTCPQNRYSTSAALLHMHFTAIILEGATGAKHWITRLSDHEPKSGIAYRKKLARYHRFYEALTDYAKRMRPFGCKIPLSRMQRFDFGERNFEIRLSPWSSSFLERIGVPLYFANEGEGVVFLDDLAADAFTDDEIRGFLGGTLILSVGAAERLSARGFTDDIGVTVRERRADVISGEIYNGIVMPAQYGVKELCKNADSVETLSEVYHLNTMTEEKHILFPGVTRYENALGGEIIVFSGTPDMPFKYFTAFSLLNETRKRQLVDILKRRGNLPLYYTGDAEVYVRAGMLSSSEILVALFNLSQDPLDEITLEVDFAVSRAEILNGQGEREEVDFSIDGRLLTVNRSVEPTTPIVLFLS